MKWKLFANKLVNQYEGETAVKPVALTNYTLRRKSNYSPNYCDRQVHLKTMIRLATMSISVFFYFFLFSRFLLVR